MSSVLHFLNHTIWLLTCASVRNVPWKPAEGERGGGVGGGEGPSGSFLLHYGTQAHRPCSKSPGCKDPPQPATPSLPYGSVWCHPPSPSPPPDGAERTHQRARAAAAVPCTRARMTSSLRHTPAGLKGWGGGGGNVGRVQGSAPLMERVTGASRGPSRTGWQRHAGNPLHTPAGSARTVHGMPKPYLLLEVTVCLAQ